MSVEARIMVSFEVDSKADVREVEKKIREAVESLQLDEDPDADVRNVETFVYRVHVVKDPA